MEHPNLNMALHLVEYIVAPFRERLVVVDKAPQERVGDVRWRVWERLVRMPRLVERRIND